MAEFKSFASTLACIAAFALASCGTTGSSRVVAMAPVSPAIISAPESMPLAATQVSLVGTQATIGTLTDPCSLGLDDPWWIDHGGRVEFHRRCG